MMKNETKRDVFGQLLNAYQNLMMKDIKIPDGNYIENITTPWNIVYDDAISDDLPVIPECVNHAIEWFKQNDDDLGEVFRNAYEDLVDDWHECPQLEAAETWIINRPDEFARAWIDWYVVEDDA